MVNLPLDDETRRLILREQSNVEQVAIKIPAHTHIHTNVVLVLVYYGCGVGIKWNLSISRRHCPENRRELDLRNFTRKVSSSGTTACIATCTNIPVHYGGLHTNSHCVLMVLHNYNISIVECCVYVQCTVLLYKHGECSSGHCNCLCSRREKTFRMTRDSHGCYKHSVNFPITTATYGTHCTQPLSHTHVLATLYI